MTTRTDPIMSERRQLTNVAYRLLGSLADAEDAVQEGYARWYALPEARREEIVSPGAWLTRVVGRICLDALGSARVRRERYVGEWLPEPLPDPGGDPSERVTLDESVTMAFLVVLESMTPAERVAFVLHDVFCHPFAEVAEIVGRTPAACRQLASSARRRVRASHSPAAPAARKTVREMGREAGVVRRFRLAWQAQDVEALVALLDPGAVAVADGGGVVSAVLRPVVGGEAIAGYAVALGAVADLALRERTVNGRPGLVAERDGVVEMVVAFEVAGERIVRIWAVRNPDKLRAWA
ncbi:RNA polymerase sigma factor SigJ [Nonomuraea sp. NBC_01738]|uniref:RNA polymerase sigma factor SigJ n=1 Tax=Nonomuraea sp. NBC_01738 TaxID=2976003 RepID=UPI002E11EAB6|nr:RNA polymerase sigma factor SigJ [Nonomuraea sp. NBC_01738]